MTATPTRAEGALVEATHVDLDSPTGRPLFRGLCLSLAWERVAVVGRNGVGKSSLLRLLAGSTSPRQGALRLHTEPLLVAQQLVSHDGRSAGEERRAQLEAARRSRADLLLLDEPTEDLDHTGRAWLSEWLATWPGGLVVVTHDRALLRVFRDFFVIAESGCRHVHGTLEEFEQVLDRDEELNQRQYVRRLNHLDHLEKQSEQFRRRRERKRNVGRVRELGRMTPRSRLNQKRSYAQEKQGRIEGTRQRRLDANRAWAKAARRALSTEIPLRATMPVLSESKRACVVLQDVSAAIGGRTLFSGVNLEVGRQRLAVIGPNGAGKTTLVDIALGRRDPTAGRARGDRSVVGSIAQAGADWMLDESLLEHLVRMSRKSSPEQAAAHLVAHRFPLALAERPIASLSPGERVRAALIALLQRDPPVEVLVLDEPTFALDLAGASALRRVLKEWPGGLVAVSHDLDFLDSIGVDTRLEIDGSGGHRMKAW